MPDHPTPGQACPACHADLEGDRQVSQMICAICQTTQESDPRVESGWYQIATAGKHQYVCPRCFGGSYTPKCPNCQRFYHADYHSCPWCTV